MSSSVPWWTIPNRRPAASIRGRAAARSAIASRQKMQPVCRSSTSSRGDSRETSASDRPVCVVASASAAARSGRSEPAAVSVLTRKACQRIAPNGIHQMRSFVGRVTPKAGGTVPWITPCR